MKRLFSRFYAWVGAILLSILYAVRLVLEIVGYATIADDAKEATGLVRWFFDMVLSLPWWAIWWPLFLSYAASCLIALDFSFDIFKRVPKSEPIVEMTDCHKIIDLCISYNEQSARFVGYNAGPERALSLSSHTEIFKGELKSYGFDLSALDNLSGGFESEVDALRSVVSIINPYLLRGDLSSAIDSCNELMVGVYAK